MIDEAFEPADAGLLHHHGPELFSVVHLIVGGGLPLAAALWLGRWRSVRARLAGGSARATQAVAVEGDARSARGDPSLARPAAEAIATRLSASAGRRPA